jgi:hypothetical protein
MSDDEWFPALMEDPESRGAKRAKDGESGARLVPDENVVEGQIEEDGRKDGPSCPFSH